MIKYSKTVYSEKKIRELSTIVLEEVSSGVYHVAKDRIEVVGKKYIDSALVAILLSHYERVTIVPLLLTSGSIVYSNYNYEHELIKYPQHKE